MSDGKLEESQVKNQNPGSGLRLCDSSFRTLTQPLPKGEERRHALSNQKFLFVLHPLTETEG